MDESNMIKKIAIVNIAKRTICGVKGNFLFL